MSDGNANPNDPNMYWDGTRWLRYDGQQWTDADTGQPVTAEPAVTPGGVYRWLGFTPSKKTGLVIGIVAVAVVVLIVIIVAVVGGGKKDTAPSPSTSAAQTTPPQSSSPAAPEATDAPEVPAAVTYAPVSAREWSKIAKNPDGSKGKGIIVYCHIFQFDSRTGTDSFLADCANANKTESGYWSGGDNTNVRGTAAMFSDLVEDDVIRLNATVNGAYNYDTAAGGTNAAVDLGAGKVKRIGTSK